MVKHMTSYDRAFLTGCDQRTEWQLPWFIENYKKYNDTPLVLANFGLSTDALLYAKENVHAVINLTEHAGKGWFLKPMAMLHCPSKETVWIDTDCEVRADISPIFDYIEPEKLLMGVDHPWTKRHGGAKWHNSGVVGFKGKPSILKRWKAQIELSNKRGDQEVLFSMLNDITKMTYITDLPHKYNVLRIDLIDNTAPKDIAVMHWTGEIGNNEIRRQIDA